MENNVFDSFQLEYLSENYNIIIIIFIIYNCVY